MAWARVDDGWWAHPKVMALSLEARGLWVSALSWSCAQRRDVVPVLFLGMIGASTEVADELAEAGMWHATDSGWVIHDWAEYQDRSLSEKRAEAGSKGGRKSAESRRQSGDPKQTDEANAKQNPVAVEANGQAGTHPIPSRPVPTEEVKTVVESAAPSSTALVLVTATPPAPDPVTRVFDAWREATGHDRAKLSPDRRKRIRRWLDAGYTPDDLADACRGVTLSGFHQGDNDRHTVYDDLSVVLKDSRNIERFMDLARNGPPPARRKEPKSADAVRRLAQGGDL